MIKLTDFDKMKLSGFIYADAERYLESQLSFKDALKIKDDGQIYYQMALNHCYLREYKEAQACALKAIELGYDDSYELYSRITVGNLADMDSAIRVLRDGAEKKKASACFALAWLHYDNNLCPDLKDHNSCIECLELAYKYAEPNKKGIFAFKISRLYGSLLRLYPFLKEQYGNKPAEYISIFNEYGGAFASAKHINIVMFDSLSNNEDHAMVDMLFERFDNDAKLLFAFMLLEEEYKDNGQSNVIKGLPYLLIKEASKSNNSAAKLLYAYAANLRKNDLLRLYDKAIDYVSFVPKYFKDGFDAFLKCYEEAMIEPNIA